MYAIRHAGMLLGRRRTCLLGHTVRGFLSHSSVRVGMERGCHVRASEPWTASSVHGPNIGPRLPGTAGVTGRLCATCSVFRRAPRPLSVASSAARRAMSTRAESQPENNLFEYTSGRWVYNEARRMKERTTVFNVDELRRLAAESVGQTATDVVSFTKHAEGCFNRVFLVVLRDGRQVVARVAYPSLFPKYLSIASEVATIEYMRRHGILAPEIYAYSPDADNAAGVPYIMMEFVQGPTLEDVWNSLHDDEVISVVDQIMQLEARMMALEFPAGGSLYFTRDLEEIAPGLGVPLADSALCVGPDTSKPLWYERRAELDVFRGPYQSAESALVAGAHKEIAYLEHLGKPVQPRRREFRPVYDFQKQSPAPHVELLQQYLDIAPSLVPSDHGMRQFRIRHPDVQHSNIVVARSPDRGYQIVSLLDWQHASIRPMFLRTGVPARLHYAGDPLSGIPASDPPILPAIFRARQQQVARESRRARIACDHYVAGMRAGNKAHYDAYWYDLNALRARLFGAASAAWDGESHSLRAALIEAVQSWETLAGAGVPCPLTFDAAGLQGLETMDLLRRQGAFGFDVVQRLCGLGENGSVENDGYEAAMAHVQELREQEMAIPKDVDDLEAFMENWLWNEMDEDVYNE